KKISRNEFATLVTLQGVYLEGIQNINSFKIVHHKLFDDKGNANKVNWEIIKLSLEKSERFFLDSSFDVDSIIMEMKRLLKKASPAEAGFWSCKYPIGFGEEEGGQKTMKKALLSRDFWVLFVDCWWTGWMICPSITLRQAFIDSFCQKEAHKINPVIGSSTPEDIRTGGLKGYRDMAIPFPGHPLPKTADYLSAILILVFMQHDFYHAVRASMLKNADIHVIIAIADVVRKIKTAFHNEYTRVKQDFQQKKECFESSISTCSQEQQDQKIEEWQECEKSAKKTLEYLKSTRKALGQLAFNLEDLETHLPTWDIHRHNYDENRFIHHLSNILFQLNSSLGKTWSELLSETDAGIVGQCVIPMISGNLSNPRKMYDHFCRTIDRVVNSAGKQHLSETQKQEYVARSKKFIEPLNPSVKLDQSQWPTFLRGTMIGDKRVLIPSSGLG
ncbi:hypothetical protein, partial [Endozoicomonas sp. ONNA1]|uniref:hypothetical protein n=2 Tax=unclassified Endozoicomonas TaxID=2644528 RepID=UPI002148C563